LHAAGVKKEVIMGNETVQDNAMSLDELVAAIGERFDKSTATLAEKVNRPIPMRFDEETKKYVASLFEVAPVKPLAITEETAKLEESKLMSMKVAGFQVVPFAVGAFGAVFASELVDGLMVNSSKTTRGIIKGVGAFAAFKWGKKIPFVGSEGSKIIGLLLAFDAVRDLTPLDTWAAQLANKVSGVIPIGGLADQRGRNIRSQVNQVARDYYSSAEGR
jgi:hypothetical protein